MPSAGTLVAADISKSYAAESVLVAVTLVVSAGARIGLVGPNGAGKSTLLRILAGLEEPDSGTVRRSPPSLTAAYLPQERDAPRGETLRAYLARRTGVAAAERELERLAGALGGALGDEDAYDAALAGFVALGGGDFDARASAVCAELGLPAARLDLEVSALSGGEAARAALAAILLSRFDVLLLDEPTNNLDFGGLALLERFVASTAAALVVVSHDRDFLDRIVTRVVELDEWTHGSREYAGGWSEYEDERARRRSRQYEQYGRYVDERERVADQARRMQGWEERGYGQGRKKKKSKDVAGHFQRKLDRLDRDRVEKPYEPWQLRLSLGGGGRSGDVVAQLQEAVVERGDFRLGPLDLDVRWAERIAVVGPNGSGKSTLLGALLGRTPLAGGRRIVGPAVVLGELEQEREAFAASDLLGSFVAGSGLAPEEARTLLAKFGLGAADVLRAGASLSPGERTRATLALLAARGVNCLVLDEPTNHLDVEAIEELESALDRFEGTIVLVTHDRRFLERVSPTRTVELPPNRARGGRAGRL